MSNETLHVGLAIAVCIGGFVLIAGVSYAVTCVLFDGEGRLRRPSCARRAEPWGKR